MRHAVLFMALLVCCQGALPAWADGDKEAEVELQIFRIASGFEKDVDLEDNIWAGDDDEWDALEDAITLFDEGTIKLGGNRLTLDERGCHWNGHQLTYEEGSAYPLPEDRIRMLYSTEVLLEAYEYTKIKIVSEQPFEYFVPTEDGRYALERMALPTGLEIDVKPKRRKHDYYEMDEMKVTLRLVNKREAVEGTHLQVGRPILETYEFPLELIIREGKQYGILLHPDNGEVAILIRFEIE